MSNKTHLILNIFKFGVIGVGLLFTILLILNAPGEGAEKDDVAIFMNGGIMSFTMTFAIAIILASLASVIVFFILQLISNSKRTITSILPLLIGAVIFFILYMIGSSDTWQTLGLKGEDVATGDTISLVTAGVYAIIIGILGAVIAIIGGWVMRIFRN